MEFHRLPGYAQRLLAVRLSRRAAVRRLARRDTATAVIAAVALGPLPAAAQEHDGQQCCMYSTNADPERTPLWRICALECAPADRGVELLAVPVEDCGVCPPFPS